MKRQTLESQQKRNILFGLVLLTIAILWFVFRHQLRELLVPNSDKIFTTASDTPKAKRIEQAIKVNPSQFQTLIKDENVFVLDVHTPEQSHIPGTDAFIPFDQITTNLDKLPKDKSIPIAVYCRSGGMSAGASKELKELGYKTVYDLDGGVNAYKQEANPEVSINPQTQDLGTVVYGDVATTEFILTNFSDKSLTITGVSTSCGCTKAKIEKENLKAYESTIVTVSFDPAVHKDDTDLGDLTRTIYIETDNPDFANLETTITANVVKNN